MATARSVLPLLRALGVAALCLSLRPAPPPPASAVRTILLGFDGMDYAMTKRWMDEGALPHFSRLAQQGLFEPLQTTNPAQSPVSWAVFNTGCNPGKTGVAGFVGRTFSTPMPATADRPAQPSVPRPQLMLGFPAEVPARDYVAFPMALENRTGFLLCAAGVGLAAGLLAGGLLRRLARAPVLLALLPALAGAGGGAWWADRWAGTLPADGLLPYVINPMQGTNFWTYLDKAGVRLRGVQVSSTYPPDDEGPNTALLAGLGVSDVSGDPGIWYVFSDKALLAEKKTGSGGRVMRIAEEDGGRAEGRLYGPKNWIEQARREAEKLALMARRDDPKTSPSERARVVEQIATVDAAFRQWNSSESTNKTSVRFGMRIDRRAHAVDFEVGDRAFRVEQGGWSDFIPVDFVLNGQFSEHGLAVFHVVRCDEEEVRLFVPPIGIDPKDPPPQLPISAPRDFALELQHEIGHPYDTTGWACITNALKDIEDARLPDQSFIDDLVAIEGRREEILMASLQRPASWDVFLQVFSTTDRAAHMYFREFDPGHPAHDRALADTVVRGFGREFPLKDAIRQVYMNADRILGRVLDTLASGALGPDPLLLVVSDHGFSSFRRQVNLNNVLHDLGYLVFRTTDEAGKPVNLDVEAIRQSPSRLRDGLGYVDWKRTRAYSLGIGELYVNLKGREPLGIVPPSEYDALTAQLRRDLLALEDPGDGARVVTSVERRDQLYTGPWWKEGMTRRKVAGKLVDAWNDGFADLFIGYSPGYRASWSSTAGNLDSAAITVNDTHWSGDHVSVDPSHVPGVLFSNRRFTRPAQATLMDFGPTVLERYGLDPAPPHTEMDGHPLPFENLAR